MTAGEPSFFITDAILERAMRRAAAQALDFHKRMGHSVAVLRGDRVVLVPPEEIVVPQIEDEAES